MTYLDMLKHYTCVFNKNRLVQILFKWERYLTVTEWGNSWEGGYFIQDVDGQYWHIYGWREADAPWMDQAWVYSRQEDKLPEDYPWEEYLVEVSK